MSLPSCVDNPILITLNDSFGNTTVQNRQKSVFKTHGSHSSNKAPCKIIYFILNEYNEGGINLFIFRQFVAVPLFPVFQELSHLSFVGLGTWMVDLPIISFFSMSTL